MKRTLPSSAGWNRRHGLFGGLLLAVSQSGCSESPRADDVLREFPPPRLAHQSPVERTLSQQLEVVGSALELRFGARGEERTFEISEGEGRFSFAPGRFAQLRGELRVSLVDGHLPDDISDELTRRPRAQLLVWRVLDVLDVEANRVEHEGSVRVERTELQALTEVEFNAVRTRHVQTLVVINEGPATESLAPTTGADGTARFSWKQPLALDARAHRLHGLVTFPSHKPLSRAQLQLQVALSSAHADTSRQASAGQADVGR